MDRSIEELLSGLEGSPVEILAHQNINLWVVEEWWVSELMPTTLDEVNQKIKDGWITARVQTEVCMAVGHQTMIYMVKMKEV